jgi:hypothetical protein
MNSNHDNPNGDNLAEEIKAMVTFKRAGRKTKCTPELIELLAKLISHGLSTRDSCAIAEINPTTFYSWMNRGQAELDRLDSLPHDWNEDDLDPNSQIFLLFLNAIKKSIPARKLMLIDDIKKSDQWQSKAWLLERLHPDEFGKKTTLKIETWQTEVLRLIEDNIITFNQLVNDIGEYDARQLFESAGKRIPEEI